MKAAPAPKAERPKLRTAKLSDVRDFLNILYFGNEGTGKTTALASMANLGRVLYVNAEGGLKKGPLDRMGIKTENIEVWPDPTSGDEISVEGLEEVFWLMKADLQDDPHSWVGSVWDSGGEITRLLLAELTGTRAEETQKKLDQGKTVSDMLLNRFFIDQSEWGEMSEQVRFLVRRFRDLPCHFGIATLMRRDKDDDGHVIYGPAVNPALQGDLAGWVDVVCRTTVEDVDGKDVYRGWFRPSGKYRGKDRFNILPRVMVDPATDRIIGAIQEGEPLIETEVAEPSRPTRTTLTGKPRPRPVVRKPIGVTKEA